MAALRPTTVTHGHTSRSTTDFASGLNAFLDALPKHTLGRLYNTPATCLAIFRLLPLIARHLALNMIWSDEPFEKAEVEIWASKSRQESKKQLNESLDKLLRLHILEECLDKNHRETRQQSVLLLNPSFKDNLRDALTGASASGSLAVPCNTSASSRRALDDLDRYATECWETILHHMVGSRLPAKPSHNVLVLLDKSGLMAPLDPRHMHSMKITSKGFQFLLEDVSTQRWDLLLQYLKVAEARGVDVVEVLTCLFMLGSMELGQEYSLTSWSPTQVQVLQDLSDYGLVLMSSSNSFYPTRLATTLTSSAPPLVSTAYRSEEGGYVVLETNYRIYAYTSNPLQIAALNLFISLRYRFPNLVVGAITRESIKSALSNGITADQIIMYLHTHAHPQMKKFDPLLPPTVVDQIRLWELEKNRVRDQEGYLYEDFKSTADYDLAIQYSKQLGIVLWENASMRKFMVGIDGHTALREFIRRRMGGSGAM